MSLNFLCYSLFLFQVQLYEVKNDNLNSVRSFQSFNIRIISMAWHPNNLYIVIGGTDGVIRKVNVKNGHCVLQILFDNNERSIIWDLIYINSFIISADSFGRVIIWHDTFGTIFQSLEENSADVLTLAINTSHDTIYSSGVDQRIVCFKKCDDKTEWVKDKELKIHTHDVRSLDFSYDGLLASGGVDSHLFITSTRNFKAQCCRKYEQLQHSSRFFSIAFRANIVMYQSNSSVQLWHISGRSKRNDTLYYLPKNLFEIKTEGTDYILSSTISSDATKVAISTVKHFWLYDINISKLQFKCVLSLEVSSYKQEFCCNDTVLVLVIIEEGLKILNIQTNEWICFKADFCRCIADFWCSKESSIVLVRDDLKQYHILDLRKETFSLKLPVFSSCPLYFFPLKNNVVLICCSADLYSYDLDTFRLHKYDLNGKKYPHFKGCCVAQDRILVVYDDKCLSVAEIQNDCLTFRQIFNTKSEELFLDGVILFVSSFIDKELIVVEQFTHSNISKLPRVLLRSQYGT